MGGFAFLQLISKWVSLFRVFLWVGVGEYDWVWVGVGVCELMWMVG